jgi:hypothetical protein
LTARRACLQPARDEGIPKRVYERFYLRPD